MADPKELPHLLKLLDDTTPLVRNRVLRELSAFGTDLDDALDAVSPPVRDEQRRLIRTLLGDDRRLRFQSAFTEWIERGDEEDEEPALRIEDGLVLVAGFEGGTGPAAVARALDRLADDYRAAYAESSARTLARFLFNELGLTGDRDSFHDPSNSNIAVVMASRSGIPISLAAIYILVGRRLGLAIEGCNFPGHFLARVREDDGILLVDCFNEGAFISPEVFVEANPGALDLVHRILDAPVTPESFLLRVLHNLNRSYKRIARKDDATVVQGLIADLKTRLPEDPSATQRAASRAMAGIQAAAPRFRTGQLVRHRRYGYRGVVVDYDLTCKADDAWYESNRTRPDKKQPWYFVLVDGSDQVTYAAQSSLDADPADHEVLHPLVRHFFDGFGEGSYVRNSRRWPRE